MSNGIVVSKQNLPRLLFIKDSRLRMLLINYKAEQLTLLRTDPTETSMSRLAQGAQAQRGQGPVPGLKLHKRL